MSLRGGPASKPKDALEDRGAAPVARHRDALRAQVETAEKALKAARVTNKLAAELLSARALVRRLAAEAAGFDVDLEAADEPGWRREDFAALDAYLDAGPSRPVTTAQAARAAADRERRARQARLVEDFVRQGRGDTFGRLDDEHRAEAERRRAEVVKRMRQADEEADAVAVPGLRFAFPRRSRV